MPSLVGRLAHAGAERPGSILYIGDRGASPPESSRPFGRYGVQLDFEASLAGFLATRVIVFLHEEYGVAGLIACLGAVI